MSDSDEIREVLGFFVGEDTVTARARKRDAMSGIVRLLSSRPVIVGNVVKAVVALGALVGLTATDASSEAIVGVVVAVLALVAAVTAKEQAKVTPVEKVARVMQRPLDEVNEVLRKVKL